MINPLEFSEREEVVNMSFIEIKGLSKIFLQGNQKIYGIRNVNISIEYSYAAEPPVQFRLSHLSRRSEPL